MPNNPPIVDIGKIMEQAQPISQLANHLMPLTVRGATDKRFAPTSENKKSWQVTECWELHHEIKRRIFMGQKNTVIAQSLGCDKQTVSLVRNSDVVKAELLEMQKAANAGVVNVHQQIADKQLDALRTLSELMDNSTSDQVRAGIAKDLLDRGGHAAVKSVNINSTNLHLTGEDISGIKERALQASKEAGLITEAEYQVLEPEVKPNDSIIKENLDD